MTAECPLCGEKGHRKDTAASLYECWEDCDVEVFWG